MSCLITKASLKVGSCVIQQFYFNKLCVKFQIKWNNYLITKFQSLFDFIKFILF